MDSNSLPATLDWLGGDPPVANRFLLEITGIEIGIFKEVTGLQVTVPTDSILEGGQNGYAHKVPKRMEWPNIVLKRGLTQSDALFEWLSKSSGEGFSGNHDKVDFSNGAITAITATGDRLRSWELYRVFPVRWKGPDFSVDSKAPLEEELEIAHHGFKPNTH
jgi:phage tail-like protein